MTRHLLISFLLIFWANMALAQFPVPVPVCPSNQDPPADACGSACRYCNFVGITSTTGGYTAGGATGFCGTEDNSQWLAFTAGETSVTITALPTACRNGDGLQLAIYGSCADRPLDCNPGAAGSNTRPVFVSADNLVIGRTYYVMVDGFDGDDCEFTLVASPASAVSPPFPAVGAITGPSQICPGGTARFCVPPVIGAVNYVWDAPPGSTINNQTPPVLIPGTTAGACVTIRFGNASGVVCVNSSTDCITGPPTCTPVVVLPLAPVFIAQAEICPEDAPYVTAWGQSVFNTGVVENTYQTAGGCDSLVRQLVVVKVKVPTVIPPTTLCGDAFLRVCNIPYTDAGTITATCNGSDGCDSTVIFTIIRGDVNAEINGGGTISCTNPSVVISQAPGIGSPTWFNDNSAIPVGNNTDYTVTAAGIYILEVNLTIGNNTCTDRDTIVINGDRTPPYVTASTSNPNLGCGDVATLTANTNTNPSTFSWVGPNGFTSTAQSPSVSQAGAYNVTVTSVLNGCTASATVNLSGNTNTPQFGITGGNLNCSGNTSVTLTANVTNLPNALYSWTTGQNSSSINVTNPGIYSVVVTNPSNGCSASGSITVTADVVQPDLSASAQGALSCTNNSVTLSAFSNTPGTTFLWNTGQTTASINVGAGGTYSVVATGANGCTASTSVTVAADNNLPSLSVNDGTLTCSATSVTLQATSNANNPTYSWSNGTNGPTLVTSQAGTYQVVVTSSNGCSASATSVVSGDSNAPIASATGGVLSCGQNSLQISATSTLPGTTFSWSGPGFTSNLQNPTVTQGGTYSVTVTNPANGCSSVASATVSADNNLPVVNVLGNSISCNQATATLQASSSNVPNATFAWSNGIFTPNNTVTTPGQYTVVVTNPTNGCTAVGSYTVSSNINPPGANAVAGQALTCTNTSTTLTASSPTPGVNFSWSNGQNGASIVVNSAGSYSVIASDGNGCTSSASVSVSSNVVLPGAAVSGGTLSCTNASVQLSASSPTVGVSYAWPNGSSGSTFQANSPGNYQVTVTGNNGCSSTATATVNGDFVSPNATATGGILTCTQSSLQLSGNSSTPGASFQWLSPNGGAISGQNPVVSGSGTYTLIVTNPSNGCTSSATALVQPDANIPTVSAAGGLINCSIPSVQLLGNSTTSGVTFRWTSPSGTVLSGQNPSVTQAGTYTLLVTNPVNGCSNTATTTVTSDINLPAFSVIGGQLSCAQNSVNLQLNPLPGATHQSYAWSSTGFSSSLQNPAVSQAGTYTVVVTATNGCTNSQTVAVTSDNSLPQAVAQGGTLTCLTNSVQIQLNITSNQSAVNGTTWSLNNTTVSSSEDPIVSQPGVYTVLVTTNNGCTATFSAEILEDRQGPALDATGGVIGCTVFSVNLNANSPTATAYAWTGPNGFSSAAPSPNVTANGTYSVIVTGPNGCTSSQSTTVTTDFASANISISQPQVLTCLNPSITLNTTLSSPTVPVGAIAWSSPNGYSSTIEDPDNVTAPGVYTILVTTINGCTATQNISVTQNIAQPDVSATGTELTCAVLSSQITATSTTPGATFRWTTPAGLTLNGASQTISDGGIYSVVATGPNGCTSQSTATVSVVRDDPENVAIAAPVTVLNCRDLQATLNASSSTQGVVYRWFLSGNQVGTTPSLTVSQPGQYVVRITDPSNGCFVEVNQNISLDVVAPTANASGGTVDCITGEVSLSGFSNIANAQYNWTGPNGNPYTGANPLVSNIGSYSLTVTNPSNGCTGTAQAQVNQNNNAPVAAVSTTAQLDCDTDEVILTATISSPAGASGVWTNALGQNLGTSTTLTVNQAGTYTFTVTNPVNGCITAPEGIVNSNFDVPQIATNGGFIDCNNPTTTISATSTTPGTTFLWTNPSGNPLAGGTQLVTEGGLYTVVLTGPNGCSTTGQALVNTNTTQPSISASAPTLTCAVPSTQITSSSTVSGLTYSWSGGLSPVANPNVTAPGTYSVVVTNPANGCTNTFSLEVLADNTPPGATAQGNTLTCTANTIGITGNSPTSGVNYAWFLGNDLISNLQNPSVSEAATYRLLVTNPINGCTSEALATVNPNTLAPQVQASPGSISCAAPTTTLQAGSTTAGVTFNWSGPNGFISSEANPLVSAVGTYILTVTSPTNGCTAAAQAAISGNFTQPNLTIATPPLIDCNNPSVSLQSGATGQGAISFRWEALSGVIAQGATGPQPEVGAGVYSVTVTDSGNGCTNTQQVSVQADAATPSNADYFIENITCFGAKDGSIRVGDITGGTAPFFYAVDTLPLSETPLITGLDVGAHTLFIEDAFGCTWTTTFTITQPKQLILDVGEDLILVLGDSVQVRKDLFINSPASVAQFLVDPPEAFEFLCDTCRGNWYKPFFTTELSVTLIDTNDCKVSDSRIIFVDRTRSIYVANVFNPTLLSINGLLTVYGNRKNVAMVKSFKIYDRWGQAVHVAYDFVPNSYNAAWDGRVRGQLVNPAVFVWKAEVEFVDGQIEIFSGDVLVITN